MPPSQLTFSPTVALSHSTHAPAPCALPALHPRLTRCFSAMPFLKKMQAGPMGNCMGRGAGQSSRALMSRRLPLLPSVGGSVSLSLLSLLCQLFLPLLASPSVPVSYSCDSWVGNLPWGRGGIRIVPASPSGLSLTGGEPASGTVTSYPQNGIGKVVLKVGIRAEGMLSARSKPGLCWLWAREEGGDMALTSGYFGNVHQ